MLLFSGPITEMINFPSSYRGCDRLSVTQTVGFSGPGTTHSVWKGYSTEVVLHVA